MFINTSSRASVRGSAWLAEHELKYWHDTSKWYSEKAGWGSHGWSVASKSGTRGEMVSRQTIGTGFGAGEPAAVAPWPSQHCNHGEQDRSRSLLWMLIVDAVEPPVKLRSSTHRKNNALVVSVRLQAHIGARLLGQIGSYRRLLVSEAALHAGQHPSGLVHAAHALNAVHVCMHDGTHLSNMGPRHTSSRSQYMPRGNLTADAMHSVEAPASLTT